MSGYHVAAHDGNYGFDHNKWTQSDGASHHGYWSADESSTTHSMNSRSLNSIAGRDTDSEAGENCSECCTDQACTASCDGTDCAVQICDSDECTEVCYGEECVAESCPSDDCFSSTVCTKPWEECHPGSGYCCFGKGAICTGNCYGDMHYPELSSGVASDTTSAYTDNSPRYNHPTPPTPVTTISNISTVSNGGELMHLDHINDSTKLLSPVMGNTGMHALNSFPQQASCQWGHNCNFEASDPSQFVQHLHLNHIHPQLQTVCEWNSCGIPFNREDIASHVLSAHPDALATDTCLWQGCSEFLGNNDYLAVAYHLQNNHAGKSVLECNWNECGQRQAGVDKLQAHLHQSHYLTDPNSGIQHPIPMIDVELPAASTSSNQLGNNPSIEDMTNFLDNTSMGDDTAEVCRWRLENGQICGASFADKGMLSTHVKQKHVTNAPKVGNGFICTWDGCDRAGLPFAQRGKLDRHMQTHVVFRVCSCIQCRKEFSNINAFLQHYRTHTGDKPYKCKECNRTFAQGSALTMHKRMHTGEKPLICTYPGCGKAFAESSNLSKHRKIHNPIGLHRCPFKGCDKSFHRMDQYKRHFKTHKTGPPMQPLKNELPSPQFNSFSPE